jgi:hypothetical protein
MVRYLVMVLANAKMEIMKQIQLHGALPQDGVVDVLTTFARAITVFKQLQVVQPVRYDVKQITPKIALNVMPDTI